MALSAVMAGVADLRKSFEEARKQRARGRRPILFIDEIHRFNRAQQDGLLHEVEDGTVSLIGATTENPSFALNAALISRCHVLVLERLGETALLALLARAEGALGQALPLDPPPGRGWPSSPTATAAICSTWSRRSPTCHPSRCSTPPPWPSCCSAACRSTTRRRRRTTT